MQPSDKVLSFRLQTFSQTHTKTPASSSGRVQGIYTSDITIDDKKHTHIHQQPLERCHSETSGFLIKENVEMKKHVAPTNVCDF